MNIDYPDKSSNGYKQFIKMTSQKIDDAIIWLKSHNIDYVWNYQINNHLYRLYLPSKDLLLDFEPYPVNNQNYNYIRVSYNTNLINVFEYLFPETIIDTQDLTVWKITQKWSNKFLREHGISPIYDKNVLRLALVKDNIIYQCMIIKGNKIVMNASRKKCSVPYGTYILLRYLNEIFGFDKIIIKEDLNNSYSHTLYQLLNLKVVSKTAKRKIWWSPSGTKWRINKSEKDNYMSFYLPETITYVYPPKENP